MGVFLFVFSVAVIVAIIYFFTYNFNFWKDRGVKGPNPNPIFGNMKSVMTLKISLGEFVKQMYLKYPDEPYVGVYMRNKPVLIVRDLDLIKDVLIKDFSVFAARGLNINTKAEPLTQHLFLLEPERWKPLRTKLSPVFTSGKLKEMFYILLECAGNLDQYISSTVASTKVVEIRDLCSKFTTDVIGSCAFGLQMNSFTQEDTDFRRMGKKIFQMDWLQIVRFWMNNACPKLYNLLWRVFYNREMTEFFVTVFKKTVEHREQNNIRRQDFVDLLRDIKNDPNLTKDIEMTDTLIAAQAFVFFGAGFESSSTTIANTLYELAQNHDIQDKLREEVQKEFENNNGALIYDSIKNMKYLHKVFQEVLRKYPTGHMLLRQSCAPYTFRDSKLSIPEGQNIYISTYGIHYDPSIYPNPHVFDPERFNDEAVRDRHPMSYMPFGDGPRNCIASRFATYQTKVGLAYILRKFKVDICDKTVLPYEADPTAFLLIPKRGIYLNIIKMS